MSIGSIVSHSFTRSRLLAGCVLLALGCSTSGLPTDTEPRGSIRVEALNDVYARGGPVTVDLVNDSTVTVGSNACPSGIEQLVRGQWARLEDYNFGCFLVYLSVEPGQRVRLSGLLPATLTPGTYRTYHVLSIGILRMGYVRYSDPFSVI